MDIRMSTCTSFEFDFLFRSRIHVDVQNGQMLAVLLHSWMDAKYSQCDRFDERADRNNIIERIGFDSCPNIRKGRRTAIDRPEKNKRRIKYYDIIRCRCFRWIREHGCVSSQRPYCLLVFVSSNSKDPSRRRDTDKIWNHPLLRAGCIG